MVNVTPALKNLPHPLYKIFGDIPAGSLDFTHASVRHYGRIAFWVDGYGKMS
jgi:hypothetical protein